MADMFWKIQATPIAHNKLYINIDGKTNAIPATVPSILSLIEKLVPEDREIVGYFFDPASDIADDVNDLLRNRLREAIQKFNKAL
jgi:hypothetical protein